MAFKFAMIYFNGMSLWPINSFFLFKWSFCTLYNTYFILQNILLHNTVLRNVSMFPPGVGGRAGRWAYPGDQTPKTVTTLSNLTDDFGTGAGP